MPRYFFHFSDGKRTFTDGTGTEFAGLGDARKHALSQVRELKASISQEKVQNWMGWKMIVVDANGKTVLEVGFDLTPRPLH
jgi:hypothetical protein